MIKLVFELLNKITDKILSARFLITVTIGLTYCHIVWHAVHFYLKSMVNDPKQMEAFATGLIMGFTGTASFVFKAYFDRGDRAAETKAIPTDVSITPLTTQVSQEDKK